MKLKTINNNKGSALLWCILLTIILTILLGAISAASFAYFNYTMYSVKRQQAYFTARSAVNILLEEFTSDEQSAASSSAYQYEYKDGVKTGRKMNFDGNYINEKGDIETADGTKVKITYQGKEYKLFNKYINDKGYLYDIYTDKNLFTDDEVKFRTDSNGNKKVTNICVRRPMTVPGATSTETSTISILPAKGSEIEVTDFGFNSSMNMGKASAIVSRDEDDIVTIKATAYYPEPEKGEKYVIEAKVTRSPLYFGGIAIKNLNLGGNLNLGNNTDLYWNSTDIFNTSGNGSSFKANGHTLTINGNLVTKGDAKITAGTTVANRIFYGTADFSGTGKQSRKIWSTTEYIMSNKELIVGEDQTTIYTESTINNIKRLINGTTHNYFCNNNSKRDSFGGQLAPKKGDAIYNLLDAIGISGIANDIVNDNLALTDSNNNALAIQYIQILSLSNTIDNKLQERSDGSNNWIDKILNNTIKNTYDTLFKNITYNTLDASYIDFSANDNNSRADKVVPLTYMFVEGADNKDFAVTTRIRYGAKPDRRSRFLTFTDNIGDRMDSIVNRLFDINEATNYIIVFLGKNSTIHLGYNGDGRRSNNPEDLIFLYSIYGEEGSTVIIEDGVTVVGEIMVDNIVTKGNANIIYSSTNGSQVAKQKIAEFWTVANYKEG